MLCRQPDSSGLSKILANVIRVVGHVGIRGASEEIALPGNRAALHMHTLSTKLGWTLGAPQMSPQRGGPRNEKSSFQQGAPPTARTMSQANPVAMNADGLPRWHSG